MSPPIPSVSSRQLLSVLRKVGFEIHHQSGSHIHLRSDRDPHLRVVVPAERKDLKKKTLRSVLAQANLTIEEFLDLL